MNSYIYIYIYIIVIFFFFKYTCAYKWKWNYMLVYIKKENGKTRYERSNFKFEEVSTYGFLENQFWHFLKIILYSYIWENQKKQRENTLFWYKFLLFQYLKNKQLFFIFYYSIPISLVYCFSILVMSVVLNFQYLWTRLVMWF